MLAVQGMGRSDEALQGWRPDPRASLGLASAAAVLLCLAFLGLLYRPATSGRPALLRLSVLHAPAQERAPRARPQPPQPATALPPVLTPLPPIPGFILLQEQVDQAVRETVASERRGPFLLPPVPSELSRALQAPEKPGTLREEESYRSHYGDTIVKSGGGCTSLQQLEIGPVAKAQIGFMVPCPGERRPTMADDLAKWAAKRAEQSPPP